MIKSYEILMTGGARGWALLRTELARNNAFLLPLRLFIGLGWLRAGVEKLIDPAWRSGEALQRFLQTQVAAGAVHFSFFERLIQELFAPQAWLLAWIITIGELLAGVAILTGTLTAAALLGGLFMNLNFVLAGVVNPSAFYIVIQGTLLSADAGSTLGGDAVLARLRRHRPTRSVTAGAATALQRRKALLIACGLACTIGATLVVPYIRDFGPHSIDDPAMLLFILSMLGAMLAGIHLVRRMDPPADSVTSGPLLRHAQLWRDRT